MEINQAETFTTLDSGLRAVATYAETGFLTVNVQRKTYVHDAATNRTSWFWLYVSGITIYLPISKAEAMRIVYHHLALHDQALIQTTAPLWQFWDTFEEQSSAAPPQNTTLN